MTVTTESDQPYAHLLSPFEIGPLKLRNRVMLPPHASAIGNIFGSDADAERNLAYYVSRARGGAAWFDSLSAWVPNTGVIPGFEPTGVGATVEGHYSLPFFVERVQAYSDALHAEGAVATGQMVHQGGMPHGASPVLSAPVINNVPHQLNHDEIAYFVGQYRSCAEQAQRARLDGVELHMNHDDLLEYFLSPLTNRRDDKYGGSIENRCRFPVEVLRAIRDVIGSSMVIGIRLNLREEAPGGYDIGGAIEIAQYLESTGLVDYFHGVVGIPGAIRVTSSRTSTRPDSGRTWPGSCGARSLCRWCTPVGSITPTSPNASSPPGTPTWSAWPARISPNRTSSRRSAPAVSTRFVRVSAATSASADATSRGCRSDVRSTRSPATRSTARGRW